LIDRRDYLPLYIQSITRNLMNFSKEAASVGGPEIGWYLNGRADHLGRTPLTTGDLLGA
jgi:hypothetical protein